MWQTVSTALLLIQLASLCWSAGGCQSLRSRQQTRELSVARQTSLRGQEKLQQNKLTEAEYLFAEALRRSPVDERAQAGLAEVLWQRGEQQQALVHMQQAATIGGGNPDTLVRLGELYYQQGMLAQALEQADLALENQRKHPAAWALRGKVLQQQHQLDEAMTCYHRALSEQPNLPEVQLALAEIYRGLGRPQRALATLDAMLAGQSEEQIPPQAWLLKGQALADLGEQGLAQGCLKSAASACHDEQCDVLLSTAQTLMEVGDIAEARICLGRAIRQNPNNPTALRLQAALEQRSQNELRAQLAGFEQFAPAPPRN